MSMDPIRLLLVDDHDVVRTGMKSFLEEQGGFEVIAEARNGEQAIAAALAHTPDVIVMDISMPTMDGMEATQRIKNRCPDCPILALTVHEDKQYFFKMMNAGASGYLTKKVVAEELVSAIRAVSSGSVYLQPVLARWLLDDYRRLIENRAEGSADTESTQSKGDQAAQDLDRLSPRELEVLELVAEGLTTPQIAQELDLSPKTISRHRERIMNKLNLHSATALVKFAIQTGLVSLD